MLKTLLVVALSAVSASSYLAFADEGDANPGCSLSSKVVAGVQSQLAVVVQLTNGGIFHPNRMWSAVVDRQGRGGCTHTRAPRAPGTAHLRCGFGDSGWTTA